MNITQDFVKGMIDDNYGYMLEDYDKYSETWPEYMAEQSIDGDFWQDTSLIDNGGWRKTSESEGFEHRAMKEGYTVYARIFDYTNAVSFSNNVIRDLQKVKNLAEKETRTWGKTAKDTRDEFYARIFNKGGLTAGDWIFNGTPESQAVTDGSGDLAYDSKPWFNLTGNTRSSKGGGTYYNAIASALSADNFKTLYNLMVGTNNRQEDDSRFRLMPDICIVGTTDNLTLREILESTLIPYGVTNTKNVLQGIVEPIINPYFDTATSFVIGCKKQGIVALKRMEPQIDFWQDKKNRCWWLTGEMRIGVMCKNWRFWGAGNMPTS